MLTQGLTRSLQRELNSFYQKIKGKDFSIRHVTKSAFSQARAKLKPEAFIELNQVSVKAFYRDAPYLQFLDFRLLGIDGSTAVLPRHDSVVKEFGTVNFGPYADSPRSVGRVSILYDVLNYLTLDAKLEGYTSNERELARQHFDHVKAEEDLLLLDRGYPSLRFMFELQQRGLSYCMRMDDWWLEVRQMLEQGQKDKLVSFRLPAKDKELLERFNTTDEQIHCRLVMVELDNGEKEVLCTNVTDSGRLPYECFGDLYHLRWNIEEGYKLYKCRMQLESFSGKTAKAVKQDFFAKLFMMTLMAVLAFPIEEQLKKEFKKSGRKHRYKINRVNALAMVKEICSNVFIKKMIQPAIKALDMLLRSTTEIIRPGRKYPRSKIKKKPPSMNYKQL